MIDIEYYTFLFKSLMSFLKDPKGDMPWDEEENAKDVVHLKDENVIIAT